jgi:H+-translocating diphosphatase
MLTEMAEMPREVRAKTDALNAAGNTTSAIGKGFAAASAALVSLALYGAFVIRIREASFGLDGTVEVLHPLTFALMLLGSMMPFAFSSMTLRSVGQAAAEMVEEVKRQFDEQPELLQRDGTSRPDYDRCIAICTQAALREMVIPGALVVVSPLFVGTFLGVAAVEGLLLGALLSSIMLGVSMSNTGESNSIDFHTAKKNCSCVQSHGMPLDVAVAPSS